VKIPETRTADTIHAGDSLPSFDKTFSAADLVAYGGATWDWHRLHYDRDFAQARSLARPVIDGQMYGALFAQAISHWLGPRIFIKKLTLRYYSFAYADDTLTVEGQVEESKVVDGRGWISVAHILKKDRDVVSEAKSVVRVPCR
jgi:acyl dehydratase